MTRQEWVIAAKHKLIDREETINEMAQSLGRTRQWIWLTFRGKSNQAAVNLISGYLGIESYELGEKR